MGKVVVTGGAGTCGDRIVNELVASDKYSEVVSLDNDEGKLFFQSQHFKPNPKYRASLTDIRDRKLLDYAFSDADVVIHCAAYKNVPMCEISPSSCVATNITGTENVVQAAVDQNVKKVLFTSSDKAVNPTNVMGATKFVGEKIVIAANLFAVNVSDTIFAATRFGNVVGSTGSVLPVFVNQLKQGSKMTITHKDMTRFMMSQKSAAKLVLESIEGAYGGELFITKMPVVNLEIFAKVIFDICKENNIVKGISTYDDAYQFTGVRPGEKMYEELMSTEEQPRSKEMDDFFALLPPNLDVYGGMKLNEVYGQYEEAKRTYNSNEEQSLTYEATRSFIETVIADDNIDLNKLT